MVTNLEVKEEKLNGLGRLISEKEAAEYLGLCRLTLLKLRKGGALEYYKFGRSIRYSIEEHLVPFRERSHRNRKRKGAVRAD